MRRRVWINLFRLDALVSFQMGFPQHDTVRALRRPAAARPGGRLHEHRWMLAVSLVAHDFLLAAMVLCLDLSIRRRLGNHDDSELAARAYRALQTSRQVWAEAATSADTGAGMGMLSSSEAHTATFALDLMLRKLSEKNAEALLSATTAAMTTTTTPNHAVPAPPLTADMSSSSPPSLTGPELPYADVMSDIIDGATAPDWVSTLLSSFVPLS
ncbi:hypothetical protein L209DRAFT_749150 [Thermothelomyces heterothallicus CBS 203.75]